MSSYFKFFSQFIVGSEHRWRRKGTEPVLQPGCKVDR